MDPPASAWPTHGKRSRHTRIAARVEDVMRPARVATAWQVPYAENPQAPANPASSAFTDSASQPVVVLDAAGMPTGVLDVVATTRAPGWSPVSLRVPLHLPLQEAALRAMARPEGYRFDPLICVDPTGVVLGVVTMQDLLLALVQPGATDHPR